jgi:hypothetical protein
MPGPRPHNGVRALTGRASGRPAATLGRGRNDGAEAAGCSPLLPSGGPTRQAETMAGRGGHASGPAGRLSGLAALPAAQRCGQRDRGRMDEPLQLRDLVDQLAAADLPKGFGRD